MVETGDTVRELPADHPARRAVDRALWVSTAGAVAFTTFAYLTTQVRAIRAGSPWRDDPYDGVVSFTQFLVPALAVLVAARATLCRRHQPQPRFRVSQLLRAALVGTLLVAATTATDWLAVVLRINRPSWNGETAWLILALVPLTALVVAGFLTQWRASRRLPPRGTDGDEGDWLDDLAAVGDRLTAHLPLRSGRQLQVSRGRFVPFVRHHVITITATVSLASGLALTAAEALGEDWTSPLLFLTDTAVGAGGFLGFAVICNAVLHIAIPRNTGTGHPPPVSTTRRAARAAAVTGCLALPTAAVLRNTLWAALELDGRVDSPGRFAAVTFGGAAAAALLTFGGFMRWPHRAALRRLSSMAVITVLAASLAAAPPQSANAGSAPTLPALHWVDCSDGFQCATMQVPLDYARPDGRHISLAVIRLPASDPTHRVGAVFVNPGGPGVSGVRVTRAARQIFTDNVRADYDIVSFDPRGVNASTPVRCFDTNADALAFWAGTPAFPITPAQERAVAAKAEQYADRCANRSGNLLHHVNTADVARDIDRLRTTLGDATLNYWGLSYGSYLGQVYANMFPSRVRTMVLDGVVDPHAWTDDTIGLLTSQAVAAEDTLDSFLRTCAAAGPTRCAFADAPSTATSKLRTKLNHILTHARQGTLRVPGSQPPQPISYQDLVEGIDGAMDEPGSWSALAQALQSLATNNAAGTAALQTVGIPPTAPQTNADYDNTNDASQAVYCTDTSLPRNPAAWPALAEGMARQAPLLSPVRLYAEMPCVGWPTAAHRYTGPWNLHTGAPILLVAVRGDPSTPYVGSEKAAQELGNARLLTVDGYGHTSLHAGSSCALAAENQYLQTGTAPATGTHCTVDYTPF